MKTPICSMMVDLNVLDHLGITLGQHCRETVANTWNADVQHVSINLYKGNGVITIKDDVHGLSIEDVNGKYLHIGYRQRTGGANRPPQGTARHPLQDQCRLAYHCRTEKVRRRMKLPELVEQGEKYRSALTKCLARTNTINPDIQIVFVLGRPVCEAENPALGEAYVRDTLSRLGARVVYYEQMIENANSAYSAYLERSKQMDKLDAILDQIK